ncbi:hypothetical protein KIM372_06550 [Bombiscardovia nodaiensis]|uniref:DUF58 domain-containing protein n=1 Tax=Bombiscardovia nodaiensis TaxID=2932181 RepID=A0ABN6SBB3_9BIFI|nr:hypothetical protein KIM372_06550 [Bombiscardovia nodaiensis]
MIQPAPAADPIRRKIEALSAQLSLPTVRKALGILEGEHPSGKRGNGYDYDGVRSYEPGDEARLIDWASSARMGRPMVSEHERLATSRAWLLLDTGRQMRSTTPSGESAASVAANALRMFASLSLKRSDEVSLITADDQSITRRPVQADFASFEQALDRALETPWPYERNIDALLTYALRIPDRHALIILATDETAIGSEQLPSIRRLAQTHPLTLISVACLNPFDASNDMRRVLDGTTGKQVPAFLRGPQEANDLQTHRHYEALALKRDLTRTGSKLIQAGSSEGMFTQFVRLLSTSAIGTSSVGNSHLPVSEPAPSNLQGVLA